MNAFDFDMSALQEELTRVTVDKKPGAPKKFGNFMDKIVKMPEKDGYVLLRLLPPLPGFKLPYAACRVHNLATMEDRLQKKANNLYCGRSLEGRKWVGNCFFCDYYNHLYRLADAARAKGDIALADQYVEKAKAIKAQEKYYYNAIVLDSYPATGQSPADGPLIYSCGITIHTRILEAVLGNPEFKKKPKGNVFHPQNGRNLKVVKAMKPGGTFPDYNGSEWEDVSPLSDDDALIQKWLGSMNDVHVLRKVIAVEEMKRAIRVFEGIEQDAKKTFDASFLSEESHAVSVSVPAGVPVSAPVHTAKSIVTTPKTQPIVTPAAVADVEDDPLVDDEFAQTVRAALKGGAA